MLCQKCSLQDRKANISSAYKGTKGTNITGGKIKWLSPFFVRLYLASLRRHLLRLVSKLASRLLAYSLKGRLKGLHSADLILTCRDATGAIVVTDILTIHATPSAEGDHVTTAEIIDIGGTDNAPQKRVS